MAYNPYDQPFGTSTKEKKKNKKNPYDVSFDGSEELVNNYQNNGGDTKGEYDPDVLAKQIAEQEKKLEDDRKKAEEEAKRKTQGPEYGSVFERIGDKFEANSPQDKAKRKFADEVKQKEKQRVADEEAAKRVPDREKTKQEAIDLEQKQIDAKVSDNGNIFEQKSGQTPDERAKKIEYIKSIDATGTDSIPKPGEPLNRFKDRELEEQFPIQVKRYKQEKMKELADQLKNGEITKEQHSTISQSVLSSYEVPEGYQWGDTSSRSGVGQAVKPALGSVASLITKTPTNLLGLLAGAVETFTPLDNFAKPVREFSNKQSQSASEFWNAGQYAQGAREGENSFLVNLSSGAGSLAASIATAALTGNSWSAATMFGLEAGANQQDASIKAGKSGAEAFLTGLTAGTIEGGVEKIGLDKYMSAGGTAVRRFTERAVVEGAQEFVQELGQSAVSAKYQHVDVGEAFVNASVALGYGMILGGGGDIAIGSVRQATKYLTDAGMDEETAIKEVSNLVTIAEEEGVNEIPPETITENPQPEDTIPSVTEVKPAESGPSEVPGANITPTPAVEEAPAQPTEEVAAPIPETQVEIKQLVERQSELASILNSTSGKERQDAVTESNAIREKVNKFNEANSKEVLTVKNPSKSWKGMDDASIKTVEYAPDHFAVGTNFSISTTGSSSPISGNFKSESDAIEYAIQQGRKFVENNLKDATTAQKSTLDRISRELDSLEVNQGLRKKGSVKPLAPQQKGSSDKSPTTSESNQKPKPVENKTKKGYKTFRGFSKKGQPRKKLSQNELNILGDAKYYAFDEETAKEYGDMVEEDFVELENPLIIKTSDEWRAIIKEAGVKYANPTGLSKEDNLKWIEQVVEYIKSKGYDGVEVRFEGDTRLLQQVFDIPQVIKFTSKAPPKTKPKGSVKPLNSSKMNADIALIYPETKDLPEDIKERIEGGQAKAKPLTTVSGRQITPPNKVSNDVAAQYKWIKAEAIKEAKLNKDKQAELDFKMIDINTVKTEEMKKAFDYLFGKDAKMKVEYYEAEKKSTSELKPDEIEKAMFYGFTWGKKELAELLKALPQIATYPKLKVIKLPSGKFAFAYDVANIKGTTKLSGYVTADALGISPERIEKAGLEDGMSIDMSEVLNKDNKGRVPVLRNNKTGVEASVERHGGADNNEGRFREENARTLDEMVDLIIQLNKVGQMHAILRLGGLRSKTALGHFEWNRKLTGKEKIKLRDDVIKSPQQYMDTLAHELWHGLEWVINGTTGKTYEVFGELTKEEKKQIQDELRAIVNNLETAEVASKKPGYYYKPTEMMARFIETMLLQPTKLAELAPLTLNKFELAALQHPEIQDLMAAIKGEYEKHHKQVMWWKDLNQLFKAHLGEKVGNKAYSNELSRRRNLQHVRKQVENLIKSKFKGIKDKQSDLFQVAEAVHHQEANGEIVFGTSDYILVYDKKEAKKRTLDGFAFNKIVLDNRGEQAIQLKRERYSPEEGERLFLMLSEKGQQLIREYTAPADVAPDLFNRELMKKYFDVGGEVEGWVYRGLRAKEKGAVRRLTGRKTNFKEKKAGTRNIRGAGGGELKNLEKQLLQNLIEVTEEKIGNDFIKKQLATISKPIAKGQKPDAGWVEVMASKKGLILPSDTGRDRVTIITKEVDSDMEGMMSASGDNIVSKTTFLKPQPRVQVPISMYNRYRSLHGLQEEMTPAQRITSNIANYWQINILLHPGTVGTNAVGGGILYGGYLIEGFFEDIAYGLSGDAKSLLMGRTRRRLLAPLQAFNWRAVDSAVYGGVRSTMAGQFMNDNKTAGFIEKMGNILLRPFGAVESYWKRAIAIAEGGSTFKTEALGREIKELTRAEELMIGQLNKAIDDWAFDYDNSPDNLQNFNSHPIGKLTKPFIKYPYKYTKKITSMVSAPFDGNKTAQERIVATLTLTTIMSLAMFLSGWRDDERETPNATEGTPQGLDPLGRVYLGKQGVDELFVRTAKYPFINLTTLGKQLYNKQYSEAGALLTDQLGGMGPFAKSGLALIGSKSEYDKFTPTNQILAKELSSFIPASRMLKDIASFIDPVKRKPADWKEEVFQYIPIGGSDETKEKYRGEPRTIDIPNDKEGVVRKKGNVDYETRILRIHAEDLALSFLTGIYITRINPDEAKADALKTKRNLAEKEIDALLLAGKISEAQAVAKENEIFIPDGSYDYFRRKRLEAKE